MYKIPDSKREILTQALDEWLGNEKFSELQVLRVSGSSEALQGSFDAAECALFNPSSLLDEITERHGHSGGRIRLKAIFGRDAEGKPLATAKRMAGFIRSSAGSRTESKGTAAGVEALSSSLAGSLDVFQRQVASQAEQAGLLTEAILSRADENSHHQLDQAAHYMRTIMDLTVELSTARMELAVAQREPVLGPEVIAQIVSGVMPVIQGLGARLLQASEVPSTPAEPDPAPSS